MSKPKILVIDDNPADIYLLQLALGNQNCEYEIEIAQDGEEAIEVILIKTEENRIPCVIVLDMRLPKRDGMEVLREIRKRPGLDHVKVVITTTALPPNYRDEVSRLNASYFGKPSEFRGYESLAQHVIDVCRDFDRTLNLATSGV